MQRGSSARIHDWICWGVIVASLLALGATIWILTSKTEQCSSEVDSIVSETPRFVPPTGLIAASGLAAVAFLASTLSSRCRTRLRIRSRLTNPSRYGRIYLEAAAVRFALASAMYVALLIAFVGPLRDSIRAGPILVALLLVPFILFPLAIAYAFARCRGIRVPLAEWGWRPGRGVWRELLIGACAGFVILHLRYLPQAVFRDDFAAVPEHWLIARSLFAIVIWAPITEETLIRGMLYRYLRDHLRWPMAVLTSAALFAAIHLSLPAFPTHFVAGVAFALLREWRGSLLAPIAAHATMNLWVTLYSTGWLSDLL